MGTNYGPLQPLVDDLEEGVNKAKNWMRPIPSTAPGAKPPDTSGHDQMVQEANDSFRKAAQTPATPPSAGKRMMQKKRGSK